MKIDWTKGELRGAAMLKAGEDECVIRLGCAGGGISIPQLTETKDRYLVGDMEILEEHSAAMMLRCFEKGGGQGEAVPALWALASVSHTRVPGFEIIGQQYNLHQQDAGAVKAGVPWTAHGTGGSRAL